MESDAALTRLSWRDIRDILLMVPIAHVALCFVFLFFYALAYGHSIEAFYSPGDVFHVSFRDVAPGYLALIVSLPFVMYFAKLLRRTERPSDEGAITDIAKKYFLPFVILVCCTIMMAISAIAIIILYWRLTGKVPLSSVIAIVGSAAFTFVLFKHMRRLRSLIPIVCVAMTIPPFAAAYSGAAAAEHDILRTRSSLKAQPSCNGSAILRNVGDYYLAVLSNGKHALITKNCKPQFQLPTSRPSFLEKL